MVYFCNRQKDICFKFLLLKNPFVKGWFQTCCEFHHYIKNRVTVLKKRRASLRKMSLLFWFTVMCLASKEVKPAREFFFTQLMVQ